LRPAADGPPLRSHPSPDAAVLPTLVLLARQDGSADAGRLVPRSEPVLRAADRRRTAVSLSPGAAAVLALGAHARAPERADRIDRRSAVDPVRRPRGDVLEKDAHRMTTLREFLKAQTSPGLRRALRDLRMELYIQRRHREGVARAARLPTGTPFR